MTLAVEIYFGAMFALFVLVVLRGRRPRRPALKARIAAARERTDVGLPVRETGPGINLADQDACELMLNDPEFAARCDRLWQAIRDEQQKGEDA